MSLEPFSNNIYSRVEKLKGYIIISKKMKILTKAHQFLCLRWLPSPRELSLGSDPENIVKFTFICRQEPRWKNCRDYTLCNVFPDVNTLPAPFAVMTGGVETK